MSGRGRGRGRAPPSGARLLLQRSAQEAGLDAGNLRNLQDITRPKLFPDYEWHSSGRMGHDELPAAPNTSSAAAAKRSASTIYLINKSREMHHRFQNSPYYVRPTQEVDVVRYGKRPRPMEADISVLEHLGKAAEPRFIPEELLQKTGQAQLSMKEVNDDAPKKALTLEEMAAKELKERRLAAAAAEEEDGELSDTHAQEDEEEDEVADYTANHYDSDEESTGGVEGGDEATF